MNFSIYGPTRCGEILCEKLSGDSSHSKKIAAFLTESFRVIKEFKKIKSLHFRQIALNSYLFYRSAQIKDLKINREDRVDIQKRIRYIIKNKSRE